MMRHGKILFNVDHFYEAIPPRESTKRPAFKKARGYDKKKM